MDPHDSSPRRAPPAPVLAALAAVAAACGGAPEPVPPTPDPATRASLAGPLCESGQCTCRVAEGDAGTPDGPAKRYEVRMGPVRGPLWVTVGDDVLYKSRERSTACFYLDLPPGAHPVTVRARGDAGTAAAVQISELGAAGPWWYDTFSFACGGPGLCTKEGLARWKRSFSRVRENLVDPCGSTKIRDLDWRTGRARDRIYPTSIHLELVLDIYEFAPEHPPGAPECAG